MFLAKDVLQSLVRIWVGRSCPLLLLVLATLGVFLGPSIARAAQLELTWVDLSGGEAGFIIQRATGTSGTYSEIAQTPPGVTSYTDTTVAQGTTYCYHVAAFNNAGRSSLSNIACASRSEGFGLTVAKAGTAGGTVGSSPAGINCGTLCSATYPSSTVVTLTASPSSGSVFVGWSGGGCSGIGPCTLVGNVPVIVTATFADANNPKGRHRRSRDRANVGHRQSHRENDETERRQR